MEKLKNCPFCGGAAECVVNLRGTTASFVARCTECGAAREATLYLQSASYDDFLRYIQDTYNKVAGLWNARPEGKVAPCKCVAKPRRIPWEAN